MLIIVVLVVSLAVYFWQARFLLAKLNPSDGEAPLSGESNVFTDDVSLSVFLDHLRRLIVH